MKFWTVLALIAGLATTAMSQNLPTLKVQGSRLVDPTGKAVTLRGCNLGNWLMLEFWMLGIEGDCGVKDQQDLFATLDRRFGSSMRENLLNSYRANWIQDQDFEVIRSFRFNLVRLPMDYRLFEDDAHPMVLRKDAFRWTDWCVRTAAKHGIYVLLDMHGIQGGQSPYEHTGRSDQNKFWTVQENQDRAAWLWERIAEHYKSNPAVLAYDPMNEPFGGTKDQQAKAYPMLYRAIRKADPEKLVFFHGHWDNFDHYGDPKEHGYHNMGFQMHYYPGLFGNGRPNIQTHVRHFQDLKPVAEKIAKFNVPFIVGEMNPVFAKVGVDMMRRTYDIHESYGWMTTMWSYKVAGREGGFHGGGWGMVTNHDPMPRVNFKEDSLQKIQAWIQNLGIMEWNTYQELRSTMSPLDAHLAPLPPLEASLQPRTALPVETTMPGWTASDIGGALRGSLEVREDGSFNLYGSGGDIWNGHDEGRFLHKQMTGDFDLSVTVDGMDELENYAKAGLWVRADLTDSSPSVLLTTFSDGGLQLAERKVAGSDITEVASGEGELPGLAIRIGRTGKRLEGFFRKAGAQDWTRMKETIREDLPSTLYVGVLALSHDAKSFNQVRYRNLTLR